MAFIDQDSDDPVEHASFYNVFEAVGLGCPNYTEDVKVVQFFLKRVYTTEEFKPAKPFGEMITDGLCGPTTRRWITKFQFDMQKRGRKCLGDGIVNRAGNAQSNWEASISHTNYTIRHLNNMLRKHDTAVYKTLTTNQEVPPDLRVIFLQIHAEGPPMNYGSS